MTTVTKAVELSVEHFSLLQLVTGTTVVVPCVECFGTLDVKVAPEDDDLIKCSVVDGVVVSEVGFEIPVELVLTSLEESSVEVNGQ